MLLRRSGAASTSVGASDGPVSVGTHRAPSHAGKALAAPVIYGKPLRRRNAAAINLWLGYSALTRAARVPLQPSNCCHHLGYRRRRGTITAPASRKGAPPQTPATRKGAKLQLGGIGKCLALRAKRSTARCWGVADILADATAEFTCNRVVFIEVHLPLIVHLVSKRVDAT